MSAKPASKRSIIASNSAARRNSRACRPRRRATSPLILALRADRLAAKRKAPSGASLSGRCDRDRLFARFGPNVALLDPFDELLRVEAVKVGRDLEQALGLRRAFDMVQLEHGTVGALGLHREAKRRIDPAFFVILRPGAELEGSADGAAVPSAGIAGA